MKKIALTIICVLAMEGMFAQSHSFRDTLLVRYEQFDYDAWVIADPDHNGKTEDRPTYPVWLMQSTELLNNDVLQYNYTDNPAGMEVVGLSAAVHYAQRNNGRLSLTYQNKYNKINLAVHGNYIWPGSTAG